MGIGREEPRQAIIFERGVLMSCEVNEMLLERYFEEGIEMGLSDEEAEVFAYQKLEEKS